MANIPVRDAAGNLVYSRSTGAGTGGDPYVPSPDIGSIGSQAPTLGAGNVGAGTLRVTEATDGQLNARIGALTDAAVVSDADGSLSGKIRGLVKMLASAIDLGSGWIKAQLQAGENHIGEVGGNTKVVRVTPTVDTGVYANGDVIGGVQTLTSAMRKSGGTGILQSVLVKDNSGTPQNSELDLFIFDTPTLAGTYTDQAAFSLHDDDVENLLARIKINGYDYETIGGIGTTEPKLVNAAVEAVGSANLGLVIVSGGTPTYSGSGVLSFDLGFLRD
jgi:hypothetical protein